MQLCGVLSLRWITETHQKGDSGLSDRLVCPLLKAFPFSENAFFFCPNAEDKGLKGLRL